MDQIVGVLPARSKSKRTRSSNPSRTETTTPRGDRGTTTTTTPLTSTSPIPRSSRPGAVSRTISAPLVPLSKESSNITPGEDDFDAYGLRESVASIRDDPFFRNYQSPNSVSLTRELKSATYADRMSEEEIQPPPRSSKRPSVDHSVQLPVCFPQLPFLISPCMSGQLSTFLQYSLNREAGWRTSTWLL